MLLEILAVGVPAFLFGCGLGAAGYRYWLKRDPAKLEKWAQEAKKAGDRLRS